VTITYKGKTTTQAITISGSSSRDDPVLMYVGIAFVAVVLAAVAVLIMRNRV
jgi:hypothetical protein